jgi:hypothetical protein
MLDRSGGVEAHLSELNSWTGSPTDVRSSNTSTEVLRALHLVDLTEFEEIEPHTATH